jgi:xylulokinase
VHKYEGRSASDVKRVDSFSDVDAEALAILESQLLNYRTRSHAILGDTTGLKRIYATGGAAKNPTICSLMADVLDCPVSKNVEWDAAACQWVDTKSNDCSVGVAYKARWGWERAQGRSDVRFDDLLAEIKAEARAQLGPEAQTMDVADGVHNVASPGLGAGAYAQAGEWWSQLETRARNEAKEA